MSNPAFAEVVDRNTAKDVDIDDIGLVPAALQSVPSTPKRESANSAIFAERSSAASSSGLVAFPRPRSSFDDGPDTHNSADAKAPADPRLERRRKNEYKRHGSLTLAWQQRMSGGSVYDTRQTRSRLASEADIHQLNVISASPIPTPMSEWCRQSYKKSSISGEPLSLVANLRNRHSHLNDDDGEAVGKSCKGASSNSNNDCISVDVVGGGGNYINGGHLDYYISSSRDGADNGGSLFAPVNSSRASSNIAATGLRFPQLPQTRDSNGHEAAIHTRKHYYHVEATATSSIADNWTDSSSASPRPIFGSHRKGSLSKNGDSASRLPTPTTSAAIPEWAEEVYGATVASLDCVIPNIAYLDDFSTDADLVDNCVDNGCVGKTGGDEVNIGVFAETRLAEIAPSSQGKNAAAAGSAIVASIGHNEGHRGWLETLPALQNSAIIGSNAGSNCKNGGGSGGSGSIDLKTASYDPDSRGLRDVTRHVASHAGVSVYPHGRLCHSSTGLESVSAVDSDAGVGVNQDTFGSLAGNSPNRPSGSDAGTTCRGSGPDHGKQHIHGSGSGSACFGSSECDNNEASSCSSVPSHNHDGKGLASVISSAAATSSVFNASATQHFSSSASPRSSSIFSVPLSSPVLHLLPAASSSDYTLTQISAQRRSPTDIGQLSRSASNLPFSSGQGAEYRYPDTASIDRIPHSRSHTLLARNPPSNPLPRLPLQKEEYLVETMSSESIVSALPIHSSAKRQQFYSSSSPQLERRRQIDSDSEEETVPQEHTTAETVTIRSSCAQLEDKSTFPAASSHTSEKPNQQPRHTPVENIDQNDEDGVTTGAVSSNDAATPDEHADSNRRKLSLSDSDVNSYDKNMHAPGLLEACRPDIHSGQAEERTRHPTMIFDQSPILRASALIEGVHIGSPGSSLDEDSLKTEECISDCQSQCSDAESHHSDKHSRDAGVKYRPSRPRTAPAPRSRQPSDVTGSPRQQGRRFDDMISSDDAPELPIPRARLGGRLDRPPTRDGSDQPSTCRNSLFPSVVKQQSRCLSVLLQQGPHGGIRRIGPLLITRERGGCAIKNLNPAFIEMMDVQPVDIATASFLKKSNIRRGSFCIAPQENGGDWLNAIGKIMGGTNGSSNSKQSSDRAPSSSSGPGMWWPLNDDNCSDEVAFDVHVTSNDALEAGIAKNQNTLERMGSSSTLAGSALKPPPPLSAPPRKGSVSSQLRLMGRAEGGTGSSLLRPNTSQGNLGGQAVQAPALTHSVSDTSDTSTLSNGFAGRTHQQAHLLANMSVHSTGIQLADVTMKTDSGIITRSVKSISLRLLVNRLASPEGNVDSDLMTDFLNSYRFFAHPIDVMRLIIVRYLNCFIVDSETDESEASTDAEDGDGASGHESGEKYLTINGWRKTAESGDEALSVSSVARDTSARQLPPLSRNDGAIIQLRVMNIIKYWIKFHPHDFRLHHRLTRLLLLFLSHIQKQPGRSEFVNSIRQKLSSGKLLAVEMPAFVGTGTVLNTPLATAVPSQASSLRSSGIGTPAFESARSAIDLQSMSGQHSTTMTSSSGVARPDIAPNHGSGAAYHSHYLHQQQPATAPIVPSSHGPTTANPSMTRPATSHDSTAGVGQVANSRTQHTKKGSSSYFRSLFNHRSNKSAASALDVSGSGDSDGLAGHFANGNVASIRIAQRDVTSNLTHMSDLTLLGDGVDSGHCMPNGNMYASDFGEVVMEALAKSGIPTPQSPVGRTLLNYSIANRNPYRINLVGIDPAMFAEQLTLLEHELFARIGATEFSLKGRVGNLETILHTMQSVGTDPRNSVSTLGNGNSNSNGSGPTNPVPNLTAMTSWFNQATYWAVLSVLSEPTSAARALVVKQLIHVAFHCLARRNYYGAFEIAIALDNSAVRRLNETWSLVPTLMRDIVARLLQVVQSRMNFRTYRESIKAAMSGTSGPDEDMFDAIGEQIKSMRAKDMVSVSQANIITSNGLSSTTATGHSSGSAGFGQLVHGTLFGNGDDGGKQHSRKKSSVPNSGAFGKDGTALLTEQDCACIMYAIRIRAASFMFTDPNASAGGGGDGNGSGHNSVPVSSAKGTRGSGGALSTSSSKSNINFGGIDAGDSRSRRARSTSNSSNGTAGGRAGGGFKQGRQTGNGASLPVVPFVAVHMTDFLHADEANSTYSDEHQKMRSRNPAQTGVSADGEMVGRRQVRCDSAAISNVNQAQPLLNMQKFRLITTMFRELHTAQRNKYPYATDMMLQQQIHSAVRNVKAQTNDIFGVVEDVAFEDISLVRPHTSYTRNRTGSSASRCTADSSDGDGTVGDQGAFGYPLYQIAALQKSKSGTTLLDGSMDWEGSDIKDNQELEQRLYLLSKWIEPSVAGQQPPPTR